MVFNSCSLLPIFLYLWIPVYIVITPVRILSLMLQIATTLVTMNTELKLTHILCICVHTCCARACAHACDSIHAHVSMQTETRNQAFSESLRHAGP